MYKINLKDPSAHIHFIGIGGISMSGLAELLLDRGFSVSGSDRSASELTEHLEALGAKIAYGQKKENISPDITAVVMTAAISESNPELMRARELGLPVITRAQLLGQVMQSYEMPVAIAGTHGKTTTTSMLSEVMLLAGLDPTLSIGGILPSIGGNFKIGGDKYFVTEACEYTNSYHSFFPKAEIILNIDADHLDFFKDLSDIRRSFSHFTTLLPEDGLLVINGDMENAREIYEDCRGLVITFGLSEECNYSAADIEFDEMARPSFTLLKDKKPCGRYKLGVTGIHNVSNALSVIALCDRLQIDEAMVRRALESFTGTNRRFEKKGSFNGVTVIDDYAHHPTEIAATLKAAHAYPHKKLWCIFQPHTYSRTKALLPEFAEALSLADACILADIYAARETDTLGMSSALLSDLISQKGTESHYFGDFREIEEFCKKNCSTGDVLITMGAGDVYKIGENLI